MARHSRSYDGELFTVKRTLQLTPGQAAELDAAAAQQGATWSDFARELLLRRRGGPGTVAGARRDPETAAIVRSLDSAAFQVSAIGNNLNQLIRHANASGELGAGRVAELEELLAAIDKALTMHVAALDRVLEQHALGRAADAA
jgi:hypothetical protein